MTSPPQVVFLFDVDNTLLDNGSVQNDLMNHLEREFGAQTRGRYLFEINEVAEYVRAGHALHRALVHNVQFLKELLL